MPGAAQFHRQTDQPLPGPVVNIAFEPTQGHSLGRHRGNGLRTGGVPLLLKPADPAVQRGHVGQQRLSKPGLGGDARPGHQRQGEQQQQTEYSDSTSVRRPTRTANPALCRHRPATAEGNDSAMPPA
ncbi:hypothetical protein GCM10010430_04230 [Kitasatospora cystarginea]|uniref:Uncharacterized protein n=1 Tax=Kitasatospora cystarginea TaxID=58350 RepID=A0ABP5Q788_9ACTN